MLARRKSDPVKLEIAARLRRETTPSTKAIAVRVGLGSSKAANRTLHNYMRVEAQQPASVTQTMADPLHRLVLSTPGGPGLAARDLSPVDYPHAAVARNPRPRSRPTVSLWRAQGKLGAAARSGQSRPNDEAPATLEGAAAPKPMRALIRKLNFWVALRSRPFREGLLLFPPR